MKIILLGHGAETTLPVPFKNSIMNQRMTLHSFTKADTALTVKQAKSDIVSIKNGEELDYKTYNNQSTEGGHLIADRILFPLEDGLRDSFENACSLDSMNQHDMSINVFEFFSYSDGETLILTPKNNVLLSTIITALQNTYQNGNIDVYWVACRS